ncbi:MAG: hypothetical protein M3178_17885 [Pseudomonadota bacterium]|nr:hypothetical protein [Pseudomonadota bacterium]
MPGNLSPYQKQSDREGDGGNKNEDLEKSPKDGAENRPSGDQNFHFDASHLPYVGLLFLRGAYIFLGLMFFLRLMSCLRHYLPKITIV